VTPKRKPRGHPAKSDPDVDRLFRTMRNTVELVKDLDGKLSPDRMLDLRASALGLMWAYSELTGLPAPNQIPGGNT
jgi:hypothetical protein